MGAQRFCPACFKRDTDGFYYSDPFTAELLQTAKFARHADLMRSKERIILTTDDVNENGSRGEGFFKRSGYVGVYPISDLVIDDEGVKFRFGAPIRAR